MAILGIDLGTTNSLAAVWQDGKPVLIPNAFGEYLTPSVVGVDDNGSVIVGKVAKERLVSHPDKTLASFKRYMPYDRQLMLGERPVTPAVLSSFVLRRLKEDAEQFLGEPIEEAVISVPAYFDDNGRNATKLAGELAGLRVERIVNEPSAAALYENYQEPEEKTLLVFDFGGGTLDISVVDIFHPIIEIISVAGDNQLGGDDFNRVIAQYFCHVNGLRFDALTGEQQAIILKQSELCKIALTTNPKAAMLANINGRAYSMVLDNRTLFAIAGELFKRIEAPIVRAVRDAKITLDEIDEVLLVGGSSQMPVVRSFLEELLSFDVTLSPSANSAIAKGTAVAAAIKARTPEIKNMILTDLCPFSLGIRLFNNAEEENGLFYPMIERNTTLPASREHRFFTVADGQEEIAVKIAQGEKYYFDKNLYLGELTLEVPPGPAGQESVLVRFTYDINGIIQVDVTVESTGLTKSKMIINPSIRLDEEGLRKKLEELSHIKVHPREQETNRLLLARADALFEEATGTMREDVMDKKQLFEHTLATQDARLIRNAQQQFDRYLTQLEGYFSNPFGF